MSDMNEIDTETTETVNEGRREALRVLARAAWTVPVVASFALGGLSVSSAWANVSNGTTSS